MTTVEFDAAIEAERALGEKLGEYAGQWVAVNEHHVVAHASSLKELREQIGQTEVEGVFQVPEGDASACFF